MSTSEMKPENLTSFLSLINTTVPGFNETFLEQHYQPMNQAGNSAVHEHDKEGKEAP